MQFIVNEWLLDYLTLTQTNEHRHQAILFLNLFIQNEDVLFLRVPSPFLAKSYRFSKQFQFDKTCRENLKRIFISIIKDDRKNELINEMDLEDLPKETLEKLSVGNFESDTYLFEAAQKTESKLIVTTDVKLKNQLSEDKNFELVLLEDFLKEYE